MLNKITRQASLWSTALLSFASLCFGQGPGSAPSAAGKSRVGTTWSEFHRPNMARWNPYEHVLNIHNVGKLGVKWHYVTHGGNFSSPAVVNGVLYFGSEDYAVYALDSETGAALW